MMDLIDKIILAINMAEVNGDPYHLMEARRLLNSELRAEISNLLADCEKERLVYGQD